MTGISNLPIELLLQIFTEGCHAEITNGIVAGGLPPHMRRCKYFVKPLRSVSRLWQSIVDDPGNSRTFWYANVVLDYFGATSSGVVMARQLRMLQHTLKTSNNCEVHLELKYYIGQHHGDIHEQLLLRDQIMTKLFIYGINFLDTYRRQFALIYIGSNRPQIYRHFLYCFLQQGTLSNLRSIRFDFHFAPSIKEIRDVGCFPEFIPLYRKPDIEMIRHIPQDILRTPLTNATHLFLPHQDWIADLKLPNRLHELEVRIYLFNTRDEINFYQSLYSHQVLANLKYLVIEVRGSPKEDEDSEHGLTKPTVHSLALPHLRKLKLIVGNSGGFGALWAARFLVILNCPVLEEILLRNIHWILDPSLQPRNHNDQYDFALPALKHLNMNSHMFWSDLYLFSRFTRSTNLRHLIISQQQNHDTILSPEKLSCLKNILSGCQFKLHSIKLFDLMADATVIIFESLDVSNLQSIELNNSSSWPNTRQTNGFKVKLDFPALTKIELHELTITEAAPFLLGICADKLESLSFVYLFNFTISPEADLAMDNLLKEGNTFFFDHLQNLVFRLVGHQHQHAPTLKFFAKLGSKIQNLDYHHDTRVSRDNEPPSTISDPSHLYTWLEPVGGNIPFPLVRYLVGTFYIEMGHFDNEYIRGLIQSTLDRRNAAGSLPLKLDVLIIDEFKSDADHDGQMVYFKAIEAGSSSVKSLTVLSVSLR